MEFRAGPSKSAILPIGDSPEAGSEQSELPIVSSYKYLGVVIKSGASFGIQFRKPCARRGPPEAMMGATASLGIPLPIQCALVTARVDSVIFYGWRCV